MDLPTGPLTQNAAPSNESLLPSHRGRLHRTLIRHLAALAGEASGQLHQRLHDLWIYGSLEARKQLAAAGMSSISSLVEASSGSPLEAAALLRLPAAILDMVRQALYLMEFVGLDQCLRHGAGVHWQLLMSSEHDFDVKGRSLSHRAQ